MLVSLTLKSQLNMSKHTRAQHSAAEGAAASGRPGHLENTVNGITPFQHSAAEPRYIINT